MGRNQAGPGPALQSRHSPTERFYQDIEAMCRDLEVEYSDMHTVWHQYLGASRKPYMWFHRDRVRANDGGKQVLARTLEAYFAPEATGGDCVSERGSPD